MATITANTGSNNWNTNGAWVGGVQPSATSDVIIPASAVVTIPTGTTVLGRSLTVQASGTLAFASTTAVLTLGDATAGTGNVAVSISSSATITLTGIGTINYISTSATVQTIATGGKTLPNETFNATSNGSWQFADNHTSSGVITLTKGTLDTNSKTVSSSTFVSGNTNVRTLTLGSTNWTVTAGNNAWNVTTITNLTVTANTATATIAGDRFASGGVNWNGLSVVFTTTGSQILQIGGTCTVANLTKNGTAATGNSLMFSGGITVTGAVTLTGANATTQRLLLASITIGTPYTLAIGASGTMKTNCSNLDIKDLTVTGGAATERDLSSITGGAADGGGNTGLTFTTAAGTSNGTTYGVYRYWVGGTGSWSSTSKWSTTSGGSSGASVPLLHDTAIVNASSGGGTLTVDTQRISGLDMSNAATCTLGASSVAHSIFGSYIVGTNVTLTSDARVKTFEGRGSGNVITSAGKTWDRTNWTIDCAGGTYTLTDALTFTGASPDAYLVINSGTFDSGSQTMSIRRFSAASNATATRNVTLGTSVVTINSVTAQAVVDFSGTGTTLSAASSTITIGQVATGITRTFAGGGYTWGTLTYTVAGSTGTLVITGANTFNTINFSDASNARSLQFTAGTTTTVTNFNVNGTAGKLMSVQSVTAATHTLTSPSGTISCDYLSLTNSIATGGASWYAGANSTSVSGNSGWIFTAAPAASTGNFFQFF